MHGGGGWWWCVRMAASTLDPARHEISGGHAPRWCQDMAKAGLIPDLAEVKAPDMIHLVGCKDVLISNITVSNSPEWTIHLQVSALPCDDIRSRVEGNPFTNWRVIPCNIRR